MPHRSKHMRRQVALEAARLISEEGLRDYAQARRKAATRLGVATESGLPHNLEIDDALREHQRLFHGESHAQWLVQLRQSACRAMRSLAAFEPRLIGAVLDGSADEHSAICLHLHTDNLNEVLAHLFEHAIAFEERDRRLRYSRDRFETVPAFRFAVNDVTIDLTAVSRNRLHQAAPLDRITDKPMQRATLAQVQALLDSDHAPAR